jgi:heat shock protein beta
LLFFQIKESPFVERLLDKGYEVLYLPEPVDEYCLSALPEFDGKKFQNAAREGLKLDEDTEAAKQYKEEQKTKFEPLLNWLRDEALSSWVSRHETMALFVLFSRLVFTFIEYPS